MNKYDANRRPFQTAESSEVRYQQKALVQRRTILWGAPWGGGTAMTAVIATQGAGIA
jgi:hypothetical protein